MASTETRTDAVPRDTHDLSGLEAGLDALETTQTGRTPFRQTFVQKILPPIIAIALVLVVWQALISFKVVTDPSKLPSPGAVWDQIEQAWLEGKLLGYIWTSVSRGLAGFVLALAIGTPWVSWWRA